MCHGLRNPLHAALGLLELIRGGSDTDTMDPDATGVGGEGPPDDLAALAAELRTMQSVLDKAVDAQLLEAGQAGTKLGPADVQAVVRDACQHHRNALKERVHLSVSVDAAVPWIQSDANRLGQVCSGRCCPARSGRCDAP